MDKAGFVLNTPLACFVSGQAFNPGSIPNRHCLCIYVCVYIHVRIAKEEPASAPAAANAASTASAADAAGGGGVGAVTTKGSRCVLNHIQLPFYN